MEGRRPGADPVVMNTRAKEATRCPVCHGDLLSVSMRMKGGMATFRLCPPCETKWWERDGTRVSRETALTAPRAR